MKIASIETDKNTSNMIKNLSNFLEIDILTYNTFKGFLDELPKGIDLILTCSKYENKIDCYNVLKIKNEFYNDTHLILYSGDLLMVNKFRNQGMEAYLKGQDTSLLFQNLKNYKTSLNLRN